MENSRLYLCLCIAICAGVFISSFFRAGFLFYLVLGFGLLIMFLSPVFPNKNLFAAGLILAFFAVGYWRFDSAWTNIQNNKLAALNGTGQTLSVVVDEPPLGSDSQKLVVKPAGLEGKILITTSRYPEFRYGDELKISGTLEEPPAFDGFDYKNYLAKSGIFSVMYKPDIRFIAAGRGSRFLAAIYSLRNGLSVSLYNNLPYPHNVLMAAILFGDQTKLPSCSQAEIDYAAKTGESCLKLKEEFKATGLSHLTAVSGMHITIFCAIFMALGLAIGLWRWQAIVFSAILIWLFIVMIGLPASAVRAGVMGTLMLTAQIIGRPASSSRIVVLAATAMVLQNPLVLCFDVGFQLSFLAVMGMIHLAPLVADWLTFIPESFFDLRTVLAQTLSAQIFTLPILIFNFGYIFRSIP